jgi:hypothetical protein
MAKPAVRRKKLLKRCWPWLQNLLHQKQRFDRFRRVFNDLVDNRENGANPLRGRRCNRPDPRNLMATWSLFRPGKAFEGRHEP